MIVGKTIVMAVYLAVNLAGFIIMGVDKRRAEKHQYRIRETTLWQIALLGGAVGTAVGMQLFRHKTNHFTFKLGFPILAVMELYVFLKYFN